MLCQDRFLKSALSQDQKPRIQYAKQYRYYHLKVRNIINAVQKASRFTFPISIPHKPLRFERESLV